MPYRSRNASTISNRSLNRLFALQEFSLANYAVQAALYSGGDEAEDLAMIEKIADVQRTYASDIGRLLVERRIYPEIRGFPMSFTGLNYLGARYVAAEILKNQPELIEAIVGCLEDMYDDSEARALGRRVLTSEQENFGRLQRLLDEPVEEKSNLRLAA